jgi:hypothetical protein
MKFVGESEPDVSSRYPMFDFESFFVENDIEWKSYDAVDHKEYAVNCPECHHRGEPTPDSNQKLWINTKTGFFNCFRCGWGGSLLRLIQKLSHTSFENAIGMLKGRPLDPMEHMNLRLHIEQYEMDEADDSTLKEIELPYGYEPIEEDHPYLEKRGVPLEYAIKNDWGISTVGYTKNRIIVPTFMDSRLVFWQARATWEEPKENKDFKKVLNPKGTSARSILYNYDNAKKFERIIIVEGFMDSVKAGENSVATNGKNLHPAQCEWLQKTEAKEIVLLWDYDAWIDEKRNQSPTLSSKCAHRRSSVSSCGRPTRSLLC